MGGRRKEAQLEQQADSNNDSFWLKIIYILSAVICAVVAFLILGPRPEALQGKLDVSGLPKVNAAINSVVTVLLLVGFYFIKQRNFEAHKKAMLAAFGGSAAFLVTYVVYHWFKAGPAQYVGDYRGLYLFILISHIVLAVVILPMALVTLYRGWNDQRGQHRAIARITLPLWLYVSVTGVVIYAMLY